MYLHTGFDNQRTVNPPLRWSKPVYSTSPLGDMVFFQRLKIWFPRIKLLDVMVVNLKSTFNSSVVVELPSVMKPDSMESVSGRRTGFWLFTKLHRCVYLWQFRANPKGRWFTDPCHYNWWIGSLREIKIVRRLSCVRIATDFHNMTVGELEYVHEHIRDTAENMIKWDTSWQCYIKNVDNICVGNWVLFDDDYSESWRHGWRVRQKIKK